MEFLSPAWFSALVTIILIDIVLAGDNALVIALAARGLPAHLQTRAIVWGTVGAIAVRALLTVIVVWLLQIPGLMLLGGIGLLWISYHLLAGSGAEAGHTDSPKHTTFFGAMKTIVIADALMGVDNVLGVAGAAHGDISLVIIGLLVSVPIVVWGSTLVLRLVNRFPAITYLGAAVLAFTAAQMIVREPLLDPVVDPHLMVRVTIHAAAVVGVLAAGWWATQRRGRDIASSTAA